MKQILTIVMAVIIIALAGFSVYMVLNNKKQEERSYIELTEKDNQINELQTQINYIGELVQVYQLAYSVESGAQINDYDLIPVDVPARLAMGAVQNIEDLKGTFYKLDIEEGTVLLEHMVLNFELEQDMRYLDVILDEIPIGLKPGDYIDLRISFVLGQDFVGLTHKRVVQINDKTIKLIVNQKDVYIYQSMHVDKAYYKGTKIYGIQYIDGNVQLSGADYYPVRLEVLATLVQDPNIKSDYSSVSIVDRSKLEKALNFNDEAIKAVLENVIDGKKTLEDLYSKAELAYLDALKKAEMGEAGTDYVEENGEGEVEIGTGSIMN